MKLLAKMRNAICPDYRVSIEGRAGIRYREGKKTMAIDSERLSSEFDMVIYTDSISRWLPPHEAELVTPAQKEKIRKNLARSLRALKIDWQQSTC